MKFVSPASLNHYEACVWEQHEPPPSLQIQNVSLPGRDVDSSK